MNCQQATTGYVVSGDVKIHYRRFSPVADPLMEVDAAAPVLIVHGLSYFSYDWIDVATELAKDREVVAIDLRGFGESDWSPARDYGLRTMAQDIVRVLDHLSWGKAALVGHSMGGRICLCTAAWYPDRVSALICLDFAPDVEVAGRKNVASRIGNQPDYFVSVDAALEYHGIFGEPHDSPKYQRFKAFLKPTEQGLLLKRDLHYRDQFKEVLLTGKSQPLNVDLWAMVAALEMPAKVVRGNLSDMLSQQTLAKIRDVNPRVATTEIPGTHDLPGDNPTGLVQVIGAFLRDCP